MNKKKKLTALLCTVILATTGCGAGMAKDVENTQVNAAAIAEDNFIRIDDELVQKLMGEAHFISAVSTGSSAAAQDFDVSYVMSVNNTSAAFVMADEKGAYGEAVLCELYEGGENAEFTVYSMSAGKIDKSEAQSVEFEKSADHTYKVELSVRTLQNDSKENLQSNDTTNENINVIVTMAVSVNGQNVGSFDVHQLSLGAVGVYKQRGVTTALLDDVVVKSGDKILFQDDFDGNFANNVFPYNYANEPTSMFSPYYTKIVSDGIDGNEANAGNSLKNSGDNGMLQVSSGLILTQTESDGADFFRKEIAADPDKVKKAYICLTALGSFDITMNGVRVNRDYFSPGRLLYNEYLSCLSYDITDLLEKENTLDIGLFHGFFDRGVGYAEIAYPWGKEQAIKGGIVFEYEDGSVEMIPTDDSFKVCSDTSYRFDDIYQGELIDDRYVDINRGELIDDRYVDINQGEVAGTTSSFIWQDALVDAVEERFLTLPIMHKENDPIREVETLTPIAVTEPVEGRFVYDFGKNFAGTIRIKREAVENLGLGEGQVLAFRYAEALNTDAIVNCDDELGTIFTENLLTAKATDYYVYGQSGSIEALPGSNTTSYSDASSTFDTTKYLSFTHTYHGFRYLEISGCDSELPADAIEGVVLSSAAKETGSFACSDELINAYYNNSKNSMRSNMMDVPTDCPQRDERLGWSGDAQITSAFGMYQYDADGFYRNYLRMLVSEQTEEGAYPDIAPIKEPFGGHNCWGDAPVVIAYNLYLQYGDKEAVAEHFDSFCRYIDYLEKSADDYLMESGGYGDHLAKQTTPEALTDTAWCAHSAELVSRMARALGKEQEAEKYKEISDRFKEKWRRTYVREDWSVEGGILLPETETQTAYALGIEFELFEKDMLQSAADRLKLLAEYGGYSFNAGYSGMSFVFPALADYGYADTAYRILTNTDQVGFTKLAQLGFTTNPESFNSVSFAMEDGTPYENGKYRLDGSLNHAAYSAPAAYLYTHILGIKADYEKPGFEHFYVKTGITEGIDSASGSLETRYGNISVSYDKNEGTIKLTVPEGTTCTLTLPTGEVKELGAGEHTFTW